MELLFEVLLDFILEGSIEISKNQKTPTVIRYLLIVMLCLFFLVVIGLIFLTGILSFKENKLLGILFLLIGVVMLVLSIIKFKRIYVRKINKDREVRK